jgi:hypothetical protein
MQEICGNGSGAVYEVGKAQNKIVTNGHLLAALLH